MRVPDTWKARQDQLRKAGRCAICGKSSKRGDHTACSLEGERRRKERGEKKSRNKERHYTHGPLPKWMYS